MLKKITAVILCLTFMVEMMPVTPSFALTDRKDPVILHNVPLWIRLSVKARTTPVKIKALPMT